MSHLPNPFTPLTGTKPTCMEMLQFILDGQASQEQKDYFKAHMDHCPPCFKSYEVDMAIKELLLTKCCGEAAPSELVQKIRSQLTQKIQ